MERVAQILADALSVGSLYALTALGIGLIFGVMRLINFAHGELITFAAYTLLALFGQPVPVMIFGGIAVAVVLALITERAAFRPLRSTDPTTLLMALTVVIVVSICACWVPARRAVRVEPMVALRHE